MNKKHLLMIALPLLCGPAVATDYTVDFSRVDDLESIRPLVEGCTDFDAMELYRDKNGIHRQSRGHALHPVGYRAGHVQRLSRGYFRHRHFSHQTSDRGGATRLLGGFHPGR